MRPNYKRRHLTPLSEILHFLKWKYLIKRRKISGRSCDNISNNDAASAVIVRAERDKQKKASNSNF